jgi:hypothetical protein
MSKIDPDWLDAAVLHALLSPMSGTRRESPTYVIGNSIKMDEPLAKGLGLKGHHVLTSLRRLKKQGKVCERDSGAPQGSAFKLYWRLAAQPSEDHHEAS